MTKLSKCLVIVLGGFLLAAVSATSALADTTYTYTGAPFTSFGGDAACPSECNISGSFTVSAPIGPNFSGYFVPNSFSFTDGVVKMTPTTAPTFAFGFITDSLGNIIAWNLDFINSQTSIFVGTGPSAICTGSGCAEDDGSFATDGFAENKDDPGVWTVSTATTPEPSSITLLGLGVLGLAGRVRRRLTA